MRADRLVAALLFLQARGRVTAAELAAELEVSERTARRDLEALTASGVPVYAQRGRGGGWRLVGGARTDLTGLTSPEIQALFLAAGSSAASPELRAALRKLLRAIPEPLRPHAEAASRARMVDDLDWSRTAMMTGGTHHRALERAVLDGVRVRLGYARPGRTPSDRTVDPLGLVLKAGHWYLVAGTDHGLRSFRLGRVTSVEPTGEPVSRPADFDLAAAWRTLVTQLEDRLFAATVQARAEPDALSLLQQLFGGRLSIGRLLPDGRREVEAAGPSVEVLAAQLAGLGTRVEVVGPPLAREHLARLGRALTEHYDGPREASVTHTAAA
ncbi:helix-turn-helix transcriptional regulator [Streptomyces sp. NPDC059629]|uniref:helix-turn-helix transcriptional regulator n=1 Tax=Streptomyces sp. NPDC059629 TaxID=3346889 RepID=UPI0036C726A3